MQYHSQLADFAAGEDSAAYWSRQPDGTCILFVHGFRGAATSTWEQFPSLLLNEQAFATIDIVFYGYDSHLPAENSAAELYHVISELFDDPSHLILGSLATIPGTHERAAAPYRRLIIVAHSLGAAICRRIAVFAHRQSSAWADKFELLLFAPAHTGAKVLNAIVPIFGGTLNAAAGLFIQSIADLQPGSAFLTALATETQALLLKRPVLGKTSLIARNVVSAADDHVVEANGFCQDPPAKVIHNQSHISVCKPAGPYLDPLKLLRAVL